MKIQLKTMGDTGAGHLVHFGETPEQAAIRIAFYCSPLMHAPLAEQIEGISVLVATNDPLVFDLEPIRDEARKPLFDEDGEWVGEHYDLSRHPGAVACSALLA